MWVTTISRLLAEFLLNLETRLAKTCILYSLLQYMVSRGSSNSGSSSLSLVTLQLTKNDKREVETELLLLTFSVWSNHSLVPSLSVPLNDGYSSRSA